jgi:hypothetical protein
VSGRLKQSLAIGAIVLGVALALWAVFGRKSDDELIQEQLDNLALAIRVENPDENPIFRASRLKEKFETLFTPSVRVSVPELQGAMSVNGREDLVKVATRAGTYWRSAEVSFSDVEIVQAGGENNRKVDATALLTAEERGELRRDERHVTFGFTKVDGDWLIDSLTVSPKAENAAE